MHRVRRVQLHHLAFPSPSIVVSSMTLSVRGDYVGGDKCNWPYDLDFSPFINGEHGMVPGLGQNEGYDGIWIRIPHLLTAE